MSENAEREQAKELPAQMCTDGEPDSVGTILETQQPSISTCFNYSDENGPPVSVHNLHKLEVYFYLLASRFNRLAVITFVKLV